MLNLHAVAKKQAAAKANPVAEVKVAAEIRMQKDVAELDTGNHIRVVFPNPDDLLRFNVDLTPDTGMYQGAKIVFEVEIPKAYPHAAPKVHCVTKVYHPNIDLQGHVCLNILRDDWKPILNVNAVLYGLQYLFLEPNPDDPLNKDAAKVMIEAPDRFRRNVEQSLAGRAVDGESFPKLRA